MSRSRMAGAEYELKPFRYSSHDRILKLLERETKPVKILDVGTAGGYLGKILKERGHCVAGIECDAATSESAKQFYDSFQVADIETFELPYRREFDYILFADVLEHLRDPAAVLQAYIPALKDSGKIVISVPNVANLVVRLSLMFGHFDYTDRGILDRTHLRFFTLRSLRKMMSEVSCDVSDVVPTSLPVQLVLPFTAKKFFVPFHEILHALTLCWKTVFAYQFVIVASPDRPAVLFDRTDEALVEKSLTRT